MNRKKLIELLKEHHQEHLLRFYDALPSDGQARLSSQLEGIDWKLLSLAQKGKPDLKQRAFQPLAGMDVEQIELNHDKYQKIGMQAISSGKVAAVLLAGGQGTRLGCDGPKGCVNIGMTKELYIFEMLFKNTLEVAKKAKAWIPFYIMTSDKNNEQTIDFLKKHQYFGYPKEYITFYIQDKNPSIDYAGKLLMEAPDQLSLSPNGNGGWFSSMVRAGLPESLHQRGIEWINVFAVDNVLQKIADPVFIGAVIATDHYSGAKVVRKANPTERVGVLCLEDNRPSIVEYYEMTKEMIQERDSDGRLSYAYGVILNYLFRVDQLEKIHHINMPVHIVEKKIPYLTSDGTYMEPDQPNGFKFEELVLDMVHLFDNCLPFEVVRDQEFAPIKNAVGEDSIDTARELLKKNGYLL